MTPQVNCLAHQAERGCNGEEKCTTVSLAEPDKNLKMFWCFRALKKQAQSGFPNDKCFPGSPGRIYTPAVIFQLPFFTVQPTLSYLCWNSILKRPKKELFSSCLRPRSRHVFGQIIHGWSQWDHRNREMEPWNLPCSRKLRACSWILLVLCSTRTVTAPGTPAGAEQAHPAPWHNVWGQRPTSNALMSTELLASRCVLSSQRQHAESWAKDHFVIKQQMSLKQSDRRTEIGKGRRK